MFPNIWATWSAISRIRAVPFTSSTSDSFVLSSKKVRCEWKTYTLVQKKTSSFKLFHDYKKTDLVTIFIVYQKYMQYFNFFHLLTLDVLSWFDIKLKFYSTNIIMHYSWYLKISGYSYDWKLKYIGTCTVCFLRSGKLFNPKSVM